MFEFIQLIDDSHGIPNNINLFNATGRSLYEIVNLFQKGKLSHAHLIYIGNHSLDVYLLNPHRFKFKQGKFYHLCLKSLNQIGTIQMFFDSNRYVPKQYIPKINENIDIDTINLLFNKKLKSMPILQDYQYYNGKLDESDFSDEDTYVKEVLPYMKNSYEFDDSNETDNNLDIYDACDNLNEPNQPDEDINIPDHWWY